MKRKLRTPFLIVNPKAYIYGDESLQLALICEELTQAYGLDIVYTCQHADIRMIANHTNHIIVTAQHMDPILPGRGMGHILPESIANAGAQAVILNHAEHQISAATLDKTLKRAKELHLITIVCADTPEESAAIATLHPDVMICEPTDLIGSGHTSNDSYIRQTIAAVKSVHDDIMVLEASGVTTGADVYRVAKMGADASGGTSGILNAPNRREKIIEMLEALKKFQQESN